ncbi:MAG: class I SAM-dependent methyltransferase [Phycisphaerales bacterium]|nr:MAG: class I SAM-dependent methyltransferase [Phycisphaerales bacterium]
MSTWHEDDAFWDTMAPVLFTEERWKQAPVEAGQILELMEIPEGAAILDMGCGPGRHAVEFAGRGYRVTGVDRTVKYLELARQAAEKRGVEVEWFNADMREFRRDGAFDAVVSLLTSFGYFADPREDRRVAENFLADLRPGGYLVMELMGKEVLARVFRPTDWHQESDGTMVLEDRRITDDWAWIDVRWVVLRGERCAEHHFGHRLYSALELKELLGGVGFADVHAYGSLSGTRYDHEAERLVVVARKPPSR